jgi:hypothetical protein
VLVGCAFRRARGRFAGADGMLTFAAGAVGSTHPLFPSRAHLGELRGLFEGGG